LYDLGPPACALKANMLHMWRNHFVLEEGMLEVECTNMTPEKVLKTSGHVDKFSDLMVKDSKTGECLRADHLLENHIDRLLDADDLTSKQRQDLEHIRAQADAYSPKELHEQMNKLGIKDSDDKLFEMPYEFNLMFKTTIGPEGTWCSRVLIVSLKHNEYYYILSSNITKQTHTQNTGTRVGYLRPETAQGIFVNFKKLLEYNTGKMPFAAAQIGTRFLSFLSSPVLFSLKHTHTHTRTGTGFRNEIAPRSGLLRVREFPMAEIEHFVNPEEKDHPKFDFVSEDCLPLFPQDNQLGDGKIIFDKTLKTAVSDGTINNQTLAYFMART